MAKYDTLPIYKAVYDFLLRIMHVVSKFPREYKYTIGQKIQDTAINMVVLIYKANSVKDKIPYLKELDENIQTLYLFLRITHDIKIMPVEKFASLVQIVDDIFNQTTGWLKSNEKLRESAKSKD